MTKLLHFDLSGWHRQPVPAALTEARVQATGINARRMKFYAIDGLHDLWGAKLVERVTFPNPASRLREDNTFIANADLAAAIVDGRLELIDAYVESIKPLIDVDVSQFQERLVSEGWDEWFIITPFTPEVLASGRKHSTGGIR